MNPDIIAALHSLKEDASWAWKEALEGREPDMHTLGTIWKRLERAIIQQDLQRKEGVYR